MTQTMKLGDSIKVFLRGESPWATVVDVLPDGSCMARIDNKLFMEFSEIERARFMKDGFCCVDKITPTHSFKQNDVVHFIKTPFPENPNGFIWEPAP